MFKKMMQEKHVASLPELYEMAVELGVKMMPCQMSMAVMEFDPKNFQPNVTNPVGVATFLEEAAESKVTLFTVVWRIIATSTLTSDLRSAGSRRN
jgi:peroxiredoxin family protein